MGISSIRPDETALITGPGAIGLLVLQVAKAMGARILITGTRKDEQRLQLALRLGADHVFQVDRQDLHPFIGRLTDGKGVDLAFECSVFEGGAKDCLASVKKGGDMIQVGLFGHPIPLNCDELVLKEVRIKGSFGHNPEAWAKAIHLLDEKKVQLKPLITDEFPLDQWNDVSRFFEEGRGFKYLLYPVD
jgi:L-iditol 2-dehydrogenase